MRIIQLCDDYWYNQVVNLDFKKIFLLVLSWGWLFLLGVTPTQAAAPNVACTASSINVAEYVAPNCGGDCPPVKATAKSSSGSYVGSVSNRIEWLDGSTFKQNSNDIHFLYRVEGGLIKFLQDTIWDNSFFCQENGQGAFYRVYDQNNQWGRGELKTQMSCGESVTSSGSIKTYAKVAGIESNPLMSLPDNACTVPGQSNQSVSVTKRVIFQGQAICNGQQNIDTLVVENVSGPGAGETYVYCRGQGLCAWYQSVDYSDSTPAEWKSSTDVCDLKGGSTTSSFDSSRKDQGLMLVTPTNPATSNEEGQLGYKFNYTEINKPWYQLYKDLIKQGYEAYCSVPTLWIEALVSEATKDTIGSMFYSTQDRVEMAYTQTFDYIDSMVPLWRNKNIFVLSDSKSLESFWGNLDSVDENDDPAAHQVESSAIYSLLSPEQQCFKQLEILDSTVSKCQQYGQADCPLELDLEESGESLGLTNLELASQINGVASQMGLSGDKFKTQFCGLANTPNPDGSTSTFQKEHAQQLKALSRTPLFLPNNYRYAFVVLAAELYGPEEPGANAPRFNFLEYSGGEGGYSRPRYDVRVIAFKFPDIGTNRDYTDPNEYEDPLQLTRNARLTLDQQADLAAAREEYFKLPDDLAAQVPDYAPFITCGYDPEHPNQGESCTKPMVAALVHMVNTRINSNNLNQCELFAEQEPTWNYEKVKYIGSEGGISDQDKIVQTIGNITHTAGSVYQQLVAQWTANSLSTTPDENSAPAFNFWSVYRFKNHADTGANDAGLPGVTVGNRNTAQHVDEADPNRGSDSVVPYCGPGEVDDYGNCATPYEAGQLIDFRFGDFESNSQLPPSSHGGDTDNPKARLYGYLVYPQGFELATVENVLYGTFSELDTTGIAASDLAALSDTEVPETTAGFNGIIYGDKFEWLKKLRATQPFLKLWNIDWGFGEGGKATSTAEDFKTNGNTNSYPSNQDRNECINKCGNSCPGLFTGCVDACVNGSSTFTCGNLTANDFVGVDKKTPQVNIISSQNDTKAPRVLGAVLGKVTLYIQKVISPLDSPMAKYIAACEQTDNPTENFLLGTCQNPDAAASELTSDAIPSSCQDFASQMIDLPNSIDEYKTLTYSIAEQKGVDPNLLWGVVNIESGRVLTAIANGQSQLACKNTINSCGAVGPMQVIVGDCVTDSCTSANTGILKTFDRTGNFCNIEDSLKWAADYLNQNRSYVTNLRPGASAKQILYMMAGRYYGLPDATLVKDACEGAPAVSGCNGLNYCQCAVDGFDGL